MDEKLLIYVLDNMYFVPLKEYLNLLFFLRLYYLEITFIHGETYLCWIILF